MEEAFVSNTTCPALYFVPLHPYRTSRLYDLSPARSPAPSGASGSSPA